MSWFTKKTPKALIAGMHLTRDEAQILVQACQELQRFMTRQTEEIEAFLKIRGSNDAHRALKSIRERHRHIYERLDDLALRLRNKRSKEPLRKELEETARSMARKRILWNDRSRPLEMGWKAAAERYWPRIADNYATLVTILGSFKQGLENSLRNEALWSDEARRRNRRASFKFLKSALKRSTCSKPRPKSGGKHVVFEETFHWRIFCNTDAPEEVGEAHADTDWHVYGRGTGFVKKLGSDEKRPTKEFHARAHARRTEAQIAARYRESRRLGEAGGREEGREAKRRETGPVFGRPRIETRGGRRRTTLLFG